ncbi:hypothetical protein HNQ88_004579 [Aureibacter tunicatorum]|uniref:Glycosyl transferase family 51 domain-containing protein n=2 Tax=Aureibacter tunicatorum TaxID=866807 RepID=A0AAE3XRW5_9BACT|nr:hypothetical protein [Aureibacter tunicatorum]
MIRKIIKILLIVFLALIIIISSFVLYIVYQLETSIDEVLSKEQQEWVYNEIENTESLPDKYIDTLEEYYPDKFKYSFWEVVLIAIKNHWVETCQCDRVLPLSSIPGKRMACPDYYPFTIIFDLREKVITLFIEEKFTQRKCFEYYMSKTYFGGATIGISKASRKYFDKELVELNEKEILMLNLISIRPAQYRSSENIEELAEKVELFIERHHKSRGLD